MKPSDYVRKGWCQGSTARDPNGVSCTSFSTDAVQWCLIGAIGIAYPEDISIRMRIADRLQIALGHNEFAKWNDDPKRIKAEVVALLESIGE